MFSPDQDPDVKVALQEVSSGQVKLEEYNSFMGEVVSLLGPLLWILIGLSIGWAVTSTVARGLATLNAIGVGIFIILCLGIILYFFRRKKRAWYGIFEIISAVLLGAFTIAQSVQHRDISFANFLKEPDSLSALLGLSSSVYIVVRGLDNRYEALRGKKKQSEGPYLR